jgi:hypothetical protein
MEYDDAACVSAIDVSRSAKCAEAKVHPAWTSVVVGAAGNAFSRTVTSPLDCTRLQMMADAGKCENLVDCMKGITKLKAFEAFGLEMLLTLVG